MGRLTGRSLVATSLVVLLGACSNAAPTGPTASPAATQQTAEASPSLQPTDSPLPTVPPTTPTPSEDASPCSYRGFDGPWTVDPLLAGSAVKVAVAELNLRTGPCTDSKRIATLKKGDILIVSDLGNGPRKGNGYPWYNVTRIQVSGADGGLPPLPLPPLQDFHFWGEGWIAANDGAKPYVTPVAPRCPSTIDLENVRGMLPAERLACFDGPITLEGTFGCGGCGGAGGPIAKPGWLATGFETNNLRTRWADGEQPVSIYFKPSGPEQPKEGSIIRVKVHVDDPASLKCTLYFGLEEPPFTAPDEIAIPYCRERMVVESYVILGTDPNFPH